MENLIDILTMQECKPHYDDFMDGYVFDCLLVISRGVIKDYCQECDPDNLIPLAHKKHHWNNHLFNDLWCITVKTDAEKIIFAECNPCPKISGRRGT